MFDPARRTRLFPVAAIVLAMILMEAVAYGIELASERLLVEPVRRRDSVLREQSERIAALLDSTGTSREILDSALGWRYRADFASPTDNLNSQGVRAPREYDAVAARGILRIAAFGDSFVYGNEVRDADTWSALLEAAASDLEVLNYGVGGYGVDQAFLRFQSEGMKLRPDIVIIGFSPDDLRRIVNVYRRFISSREWPLSKPRFILDDDSALKLIPNPLPRPDDYRALMSNPAGVRALGMNDAWYSPTIYENPLYDALATLRIGHAVWLRLHNRYFDDDRLARGGVFNDESTAFALQSAVLRAFADSVEAADAIPVILMLPDRGSVDAVCTGAPAAYAPLQSALMAAGIPVWDVAEAFRSESGPIDRHFMPGGHYSRSGNQVVAGWLNVRLDSLRAATSS